jgi:hypothetical protein
MKSPERIYSMGQHECVGRFYDEHTQNVHNTGWPRTVEKAMELAERILEDGRTLSADYEKLQEAAELCGDTEAVRLKLKTERDLMDRQSREQRDHIVVARAENADLVARLRTEKNACEVLEQERDELSAARTLQMDNLDSLTRHWAKLEEKWTKERNALQTELKIYHRLQEGCPNCKSGAPERVMLDESGTLCSVSGKPGRWGHAWDDYHWYCDEAGAIARNEKLEAALNEVHGAAKPWLDDHECSGLAEQITGIVDGVLDNETGES